MFKQGILLAILCFFLGWLGIDKLVNGSLKLCLIKFVCMFIIVGVVWNIADIIMAILNKYKLDPRKYLK